MSTDRIQKLYDYPVLIFYIFHLMKGEKNLREWSNELRGYPRPEGNPLRVFVEMIDEYSTDAETHSRLVPVAAKVRTIT